MKGTAKTLRFFAWPLAQMLGVATLFYFGTLVLGGLTKMVIFSDYAISFCFLYGIFLYISFWQFSAAYSQLALSFGATRQSIRRAILVLWVVGSLFAEAFTVLAAQLSLWMPMNEPAGRNVFLLQCGLHPVGGFCLMLFLAGDRLCGRYSLARRLAADAVPDRKDPFVYCGVCPDLCVYAAGVLLSAVVCALLRGAGRGWLPVDGRRPAGTAPHSGALM